MKKNKLKSVLLATSSGRLMGELCDLLDWHRFGAHIEGRAFDGLHTIEMVAKMQPDILIADTDLTEYNGIEVLRRVHTAYPQIHVILISSRAEFVYAQQAMRYGAKDYLVCPIEQSDLIRCLRQIKLSDNCFDDTWGNVPKQRVRAWEKQISSAFSDCKQKLILCTNVRLPLKCEEPYILLQDGPQWIWATTIQDKQLPEFLSRLEQYHVQIGVSQKFSVCQELSGAVHQAQLAASPFWGQSLSVVQECGNSNYKALQLLSQLWGLFYQCNCGQYGWDQFWALYDILMTALQPGEVSFDTITAIHNSLLAMTRSLSESAGTELSFLTLEEINCFAAQGCTFSEKLLDIRLEIQRNLKCGLFISTDDSAGELTDRIAKYLSTHFCDADITVENLAAKFFVSPAYFGQVFKCTYGISITEHINRKRMDYAEYLLTHEALSIKEVSKQVGIPDHYYFSKLYKKYKHMTPGAAKNGRGQITE